MKTTRTTHDLLWLMAVVIIGAVLRLFRIDAQSFWLDELFSRWAASAPTLSETLLRGAVNDMFPPIFPAISHFAVRLPANAETAFRIPSALAGIATVPVMFLLGKALYNARVGLIAATLMCCHWFAISYSQEGRPYALLLLSTTLMSYLSVRVVDKHQRGQPTRGALIALGACGFVTSYLHYVGLIFFGLAGGVLLLLARRGVAPLRGVLWTWVAVGIAYLPWVGVVLTQISRRLESKIPPGFALLPRTYSDLTARHPVCFLALLILGFLAWRKAGEVATDGRFDIRQVVKLLVLWATLPAPLLWLLSYAVVPIYTVRNMIVVLPALLLLAALAIEHIDRGFFRSRAVAATLVGAGLLFDLFILKGTYAGASKEPFRSFVETVIAEPTSVGVAVWSQPHRYGRYYDQYFELLESTLRVSEPDATGQPTGRPAVLWILARGVKPKVPHGYKVTRVIKHAPDRRLPWAGEPMVLSRAERLPQRVD